MSALAVLALLTATLRAGDLEDYLAHHMQKLEIGDRFDAGLLDTSGKRVFLLGENHAVAGMEQLDLGLLRYLHRAAGVRFYIYEAGYSTGELLNRYMASGDEKQLDFLIDQMRGSPAWNRENREFWKAMGEWNRTLPAADRVRVVGLDVEHQPEIAWRYLAGLLADAGTPPEAILPLIARLTGRAPRGNLNADLAASLRTSHAEYASFLGDRMADFELVAGNLAKRDEYYQAKSPTIRDGVMYETFRAVQARYPGARFYGRFGAAHITRKRMDNYDPLGMLLEKDPEWNGNVLSIWPLYRNCSRMDVGNYRAVPIHDDDSHVAPFAAAAGSARFALFRLDAPGSPLRSGGGFLPAQAGAATDYAQYVVLAQDLSAAHPLHEASLASAPPVVVRTVPEAGAGDVAANLAEIRVTFSKEMSPAGYAFVNYMAFPAPDGGKPRYVDSRTVVLPVRLQPGTTYAVWINSERFQSFHDTEGQPAVPYLLTFRTRE